MNKVSISLLTIIVLGAVAPKASAQSFGICLNDAGLNSGAQATYASGTGCIGYIPGFYFFNPGTASVITNPAALPLGLSTAYVQVTEPVHGETASSFASLNQGKLRNLSSSIPVPLWSRSLSQSQFFDGLHFTITDGSPLVLLPVHFHLDGTEAGGGGYGVHLDLNLAGGAFSFDVGSNPPGFFHSNVNGWNSFNFTNESTGGFDFDGMANIVPNAPGGVFNTNAYVGLTVDCNTGAVCDFTHTGSLSWTLPSNLTYTSDSGVFLLGSASTVPEPSGIAALISGLLFPGFAMYRRRKLRNR